jgi:hypothetical protein
MKGTYEILPPNKRIPRLRKCSVIIGKKMYISPENPEFKDVFFAHRGWRKFENLTKEQMEEIAVRIMEKVRISAGEQWDESAIKEAQQALLKKEQVGLELLRSGVHLSRC